MCTTDVCPLLLAHVSAEEPSLFTWRRREEEKKKEKEMKTGFPYWSFFFFFFFFLWNNYVDVGAGLQQHADDRYMGIECGVHQRRPVVAGQQIDTGLAHQQRANDLGPQKMKRRRRRRRS